MEGLKGLDDVAFVRFASVYKNFSAADDFSAFLRTLADDARSLPDEAIEPAVQDRPPLARCRRAAGRAAIDKPRPLRRCRHHHR